MSERALVNNAADPRQVAHAKATTENREERRARVVQAQLETYSGREFVWQELERHRLFESITIQSSMIYAASGRRDAGLELYAEVLRHPDLFLQMQSDAIERAETERRTHAAARVARRTGRHER